MATPAQCTRQVITSNFLSLQFPSKHVLQNFLNDELQKSILTCFLDNFWHIFCSHLEKKMSSGMTNHFTQRQKWYILTGKLSYRSSERQLKFITWLAESYASNDVSCSVKIKNRINLNWFNFNFMQWHFTQWMKMGQIRFLFKSIDEYFFN